MKLEENIMRLGLKSVQILKYEKISDMKFDCILLDVPCSNTGVLSKRIEMRFRLEPQSISELVKTQRELLDKASKMLNHNGIMCYSTCSIQNKENTDKNKEKKDV